MTKLLDNIKTLEPAFIKLIHERFGLVTHINQARELTRIIAEACTLSNYQPEEYLDKLRHCSSSSALLADLVAAITVGESYFFRDKTQMHLLEKELLPNLIKRKKDTRTLKIWSAGCSSGEELYTIVMLLLKLIPDIEHWDLQLLGTDINVAALEKAKTGIYRQWSMRSIPEKYLQNYFTKVKHTYVLSSEVRDRVRFKYLNLCDNSYPSIINGTYQVDLILCRNVLIYFENDLVVKIIKKLSQCLAEGAYLLLGASDPIIIADTNLVFHHDGAIYFTLNGDNK